jgi:hypothetical protein
MIKKEPNTNEYESLNYAPNVLTKQEVIENSSVPLPLSHLDMKNISGSHSSFMDASEFKFGAFSEYRDEFTFSERAFSAEEPFPNQPFEPSFPLKRGSIPSVADILSLDVGPHLRFPSLSNNDYSSPFTPYLLPNPTSYYNPLNPPLGVRPNLLPFQTNPQYPDPQTNVYPSPAKVPVGLATVSIKQQPSGQSKSITAHPSISNPQHNSYQRDLQQGSTVPPSTINFPLSDSNSKIGNIGFKRSLEALNQKTTSLTDYIGGNGPPLETTDNATTKNRFILVEQPNDIQRKSYKKENRCLLPNPLIICMRELKEEERLDPSHIMDGVVSLQLVNNDGSELPPHKQNALESIEGGLTHPLGDDHTTCFSVKVLHTSEGNLFRLVFRVSYRLKTIGRIEETIVSRPFAVYSNKHNRNSRKKQKKAEAAAMSQRNFINVPRTTVPND